MPAYFSIGNYLSWKKIERDYTICILYLASICQSIPSSHFFSATYAPGHCQRTNLPIRAALISNIAGSYFKSVDDVALSDHSIIIKSELSRLDHLIIIKSELNRLDHLIIIKSELNRLGL